MNPDDIVYVNIHLPRPSPPDTFDTVHKNADRIAVYQEQQMRTLAETILRALDTHPEMKRIQGLDANAGGVETSRLLTASDVTKVGPPVGAPLFIPQIGLLTVPAPSVQIVQDAIRTQQGLPDGIIVRPAVIHRTASDGSEGLTFSAPARLTVDIPLPLDRIYTRQPTPPTTAIEGQVVPWGVTHVAAPQGWSRGARGQGIRVAVIDTGSGPHVDLPQSAGSATFVPGTNSANDDNGHGTHVAGTVAAINNAFGVVGVAPAAGLIIVKVLDGNGSGYDSWVSAGIVWASDHGADVINLSLGGSFSQAIEDALSYAFGKGVTICAAAGNNYCGPVIHPASSQYAIAVAAIDRNNTRGSFSACGSKLDVSAPGVDILSTTVSNTYEDGWNGTSMACPHVSGVCALLLSSKRYSPAELKKRLQDTAIRLGDWNQYGAGLVQADRAL